MSEYLRFIVVDVDPGAYSKEELALEVDMALNVNDSTVYDSLEDLNLDATEGLGPFEEEAILPLPRPRYDVVDKEIPFETTLEISVCHDKHEAYERFGVIVSPEEFDRVKAYAYQCAQLYLKRKRQPTKK